MPELTVREEGGAPSGPLTVHPLAPGCDTDVGPGIRLAATLRPAVTELLWALGHRGNEGSGVLYPHHLTQE